MRDALQNRLKEMEAKNPSPALQLAQNQVQTTKEKLYFGVRSLFGRAKQVAQIANAYIDNQDFERNSYRGINAERKDLTQRDSKLRQLRKELFGTKKNLDKGVPFSNNSNYPDITKFLNHVTQAYEEAGAYFSKQVYAQFFKQKALQQYELITQKAESEMVSDRNDPGVDTLEHHVQKLSNFAEIAGLKVYDREIADPLLNAYLNKRPTLSVSSLKTNHDSVVVHGLPVDSYAGQRIQVNNRAFEQISLTDGSDCTLIDFFNLIQTHRPMLSCSLITPRSSKRNFYNDRGIILSEGKVYSIRESDATSTTLSPNLRLPMTGADVAPSLEDRTLDLATQRPHKWNELSVGNPQIQGLYFLETETPSKRNLSNQTELARLALQNNLPLYSFQEGKGFVQVSPNEYICSRPHPILTKKPTPKKPTGLFIFS
ncbi:MAG: hypothetical protein AABX11_07725 [Nanoarchaeota archaeon]